MDYTPQQPQQPAPPQPTYELKKDVTGKPPPKRGPAIVEVVKYDAEGKKQVLKIQVPHEPKANCKKCYGRGYIGFESKSGNPIPCAKCFPPHR